MRDYHFWNYIDRDEPKTACPNLDAKIKLIDSLMDRVVKDLSESVVGIAVGIIAEGKGVYSKGFGVRDYADKTSLVTSDTIFAIGSCTKAFTAYALDQQMNVDGKVAWKDKVIDHIPEFRLYDAERTSHIHVKDLMCHSSGLPSHFMSMYHSPGPRKELLAKLPYLEPNYQLREKYQYSNLMVTVAGIVSERVAGQSWEDIMRTRIFEPLEMRRTFANVGEMQRSGVGDFAKSHKIGPDSSITSIRFYDISSLGPSGSIVSSISDMNKWAQRQLHLTGRSKEMHYPQMALSSALADGETFAYGLGWMLSFYHGRTMVYHGGSINGQVSQVTLFPTEKQAIIVLTNLDSLGTFVANLSARIADILSDYTSIKDSDNAAWVSKQGEKLPKSAQSTSQSTSQTTSQSTSQSTSQTTSQSTSQSDKKIDNPEQYVGRFENAGYGSIEISQDGSQLVAVFNTLRYTLTPKGNRDVFSVHSTFPDEFTFEGRFTRDRFGDVSGYRSNLEPQATQTIYFAKVVAKDLQDSKYLNTFIGVYERGSTSLHVTVNENAHQLIASGPSMLATSIYAGEMKPVRRNWFQSLTSAGVQYEFTFSDNNAVSGMNVHIGESPLLFQKKAQSAQSSQKK